MLVLLNLLLLLIITVSCGLLGSYAGADKTWKGWRRYIMPILLTILAIAVLQWWCVLILLIIIPLTMGYGIPDSGDDGSTLGRFFWKLFNKNEFLANFATRGMLSVLEWIPFIIIPILFGNFILYFILGIIFIVNTLIWSVFVKNEGMFTFLNRNLGWEEFYIWSGYGFCAGVLILFNR